VRAALIPRNGPPEVIEVGELPLPSISDSQVLVRVYATSVNPVDCSVRGGRLRRFAAVPFPIVPGVDLSGVVERTGKNVRAFSPGDEVMHSFRAAGMRVLNLLLAMNPGWEENLCR